MSYEDLRHFEGDVRWLYKDTKGVITAGVGFALRSVAEAQLLPGWDNPGQVRLDWIAVEAAPAGKLPEFYRKLTRASLSDAGVEIELARRASKLLPTWALSLSDSARAALLDIRYNTGQSLDKDWPNLSAACRAGDWKRAADESHRPDVGHDRNVWTANQLLKCGG